MGMRMEALLPRPWALTKSQNQSLQPSTLWQAFPTSPNLVPARKSQLPRLMQQSAPLSFQLRSDKCILCQRLPPPRCRRVSRNSKMIHRTAKPISRLSSTRVETQGRLVTRLPTLDTQYIMGVGQGEVDWYWTTPGWQYEWASNFFSTESVPDSVSISWGWAESGQCSSGIATSECSTLGVDAAGYVSRTNVEFQKIGLRGVSLFAASGDSGANGRTDGECTGTVLHASFPGSSPYITAVGATQFSEPDYSLDITPTACTALVPTTNVQVEALRLLCRAQWLDSLQVEVSA